MAEVDGDGQRWGNRNEAGCICIGIVNREGDLAMARFVLWSANPGARETFS